MTDAEISRRLALAIGWTDDVVFGNSENTPVINNNGDWQIFDYRDPAVIWPIAERFDCFPTLYPTTKWTAWIPGPAEYTGTADTAAKAVALAVIKAKEQQ